MTKKKINNNSREDYIVECFSFRAEATSTTMCVCVPELNVGCCWFALNKSLYILSHSPNKDRTYSGVENRKNRNKTQQRYNKYHNNNTI